MSRERRTLLCVDPSASQQALVGQFARQCGLRLRNCRSEREAIAALAEDSEIAVMVVANHVSEGESLHVIGAARLSPKHAALPIAFLMSDASPALGLGAIEAGATGVFLRGDPAALHEFIADSVAADAVPIFGGRVLLLEDSLSHARYVEHLCIALGMRVDIAADVDTALEIHASGDYQLHVVDIVLGGSVDGIAFVRRVRRSPGPRRSILVMSAYDDASRRVLALRSGADDFIGKPFPAEEFIWRVKRIMLAGAQREPGDEELASAGELTQKSFMERLSRREREILSRVLVGTSDKDIAAQLGISYWTVRSHLQKIFTKSGALNRRDLMARFIG